MAIDVKKPGRRTRGGTAGATPVVSKALDIYDVQDSDWDQLDVPLDDISANPFNKREMGELDELAADIAQYGLDQPVSVMHTAAFVEHWGDRFPEACARLKTKFVLGFGERRWRASTLASETTGITTIRALLRNDFIPTIRLALIRENYHRKDPTALERARHIQTLVNDEKLTYSEVCDALNIKSKGTITKLLGLLQLPDSVQAAVQRADLTQTGALLLAELTEEQADAALRMIVDEGIKPADAAHYARTAPADVSPGNTSATDGHLDDERSPEPLESTEEPEAPKITHGSSSAPEAGTDTSEPEVSQDSTTLLKKTPSRTPTTPSPKDQAAADRAVAAREREQACIEWLQSNELPAAKQLEGLVRRALLASGKVDGRSRAHAWLVRSGKARFDIKDLDGYFGAVLSSDDDDLVQRATWAIALAGNEVRAADRRRPGWDSHDAAHVRELMVAVGYVPTTSWETTELERLGVSSGNGPDHTEQESV